MGWLILPYVWRSEVTRRPAWMVVSSGALPVKALVATFSLFALAAAPLCAQDPPAPLPPAVKKAPPVTEPPKQEPEKPPEVKKPVVLELGKQLPVPVALPDIDGTVHRSAQFAERVVVVNFWSTTCPIMRGWEGRLAAIQREYAGKGVVFLMVNSNESNREIDDGEPTEEGVKPYAKIRRYLADHELPYTVLVDHQSTIADLFGAKTTPDLFVFDTTGTLVYRGLIDDDSSGRKGEKATQFLRPVLDQLLAGEKVEPSETTPMGCGIKRPRAASGAGGERPRRRRG